jgi:hypothetical protein
LKATTRIGQEYSPSMLDNARFVGGGFVGFAIGAAKALAKIIQNNMNGDIKRWLARRQRDLVTHDATLTMPVQLRQTGRVFRSKRLGAVCPR